VRPEILYAVERSGHAVWDRGELDLNLNLIAVRRRGRNPDGYTGQMHAVYRRGGEWVEHRWPCTTVPHRRYLLEPLHPDGTAVLRPGQHRGHWHLGQHAPGKAWEHLALVQDSERGPVQVWRDSDRDGIVDPSALTFDAFGINIHAGTASAGCVILPHREHLDHLVRLCLESTGAGWGDHFTLTLLESP